MEKVFILHYTEGNRKWRAFSKHPETLKAKLDYWENGGFEVKFDYLEEFVCHDIEEVFELINMNGGF